MDTFIYTKSKAFIHFIDTYITELSATHGLVRTQQDMNNDMLKLL